VAGAARRRLLRGLGGCKRRRRSLEGARRYLQRAPKPVHAAVRRARYLVRVHQRGAVGCVQHHESERVGAVVGQEFLDGDKVPRGLGHLLAAQLQHPVVYPVAGKRLAGYGLRLCHLVLVVWEHQIVPSPVDVYLVTQVQPGHCRTLYMPSRPPRSPGALPGGLPRLGRFPEREIHGALFARPRFRALAALHLVKPASGEPAVPGERAHAEVHIPGGRVGASLVHQAPHHVLDGAHAFRGARGDAGRQNVQVPHQSAVCLHVPFGKLLRRDPQLAGPLDDLVVDVGEVRHVIDRVASVLQVPSDHVKNHGGHGMPYVRVRVHCGSAHIHADLAFLKRLERLLASCVRAVNPQHDVLLRTGVPWKRRGAKPVAVGLHRQTRRPAPVVTWRRGPARGSTSGVRGSPT
jgi:hypothetical protein